MMNDTFKVTGILRIYEFSSDEEQEELQPWWARFGLREKERHARLAGEWKNLVTSAGRTQILSFIGASGTTTAFAQYYAVGAGAIYTVQPADSSLAGELFRAVPGSFSVVGNSVTISTLFSTSQGNGTYTNSGLFGNNASSTSGSGTLMTHLLYSYTKTSSQAIYNDYSLTAV